MHILLLNVFDFGSYISVLAGSVFFMKKNDAFWFPKWVHAWSKAFVRKLIFLYFGIMPLAGLLERYLLHLIMHIVFFIAVIY